MKKIGFLYLLVFSLLSCQDDTPPTNSNFDADEFVKSEQASKISEEMSSLVVEDYENDASNFNSNATPYLPSCVTRTFTSDGTSHSVELDFGTTGCIMPNGNVITGKLLYTYVGDILASTKTITYLFTNFTFNSKQVAGTDTILHVRSNTNGNPQSTTNVNITITWPDNTVGTRTGTVIREWIAGSATLLDWTDDVFLVTGNWSTQFENGNTYSANITTALRRELSCLHFVSGIINFTWPSLTFTGDYGDGTCDNLATLTLSNGTVIPITL